MWRLDCRSRREISSAVFHAWLGDLGKIKSPLWVSASPADRPGSLEVDLNGPKGVFQQLSLALKKGCV